MDSSRPGQRQVIAIQWLQHGFFHHQFGMYPGFGLEKKNHQWFDRMMWPEDFQGFLEPDYYVEALHRVLIPRGEPALHVNLHYPAPDAEDVTQAVLAGLVKKMRDFRYDPAQRFRGWLMTVTHRVLANELAKRRRERACGDGVVERMLENVAAREGLVHAVETAYDRELVDEALRRVRKRVPVQQWDAFRLTALESKSGADASKALGMLVSTVYSSKSKVQKLVREELSRLDV